MMANSFIAVYLKTVLMSTINVKKLLLYPFLFVIWKCICFSVLEFSLILLQTLGLFQCLVFTSPYIFVDVTSGSLLSLPSVSV